MKCLVAWAFLITYQAHASACTLRFPASFQNLDGRVAAIDLMIRHGAIASLRSAPAGWQFNIDNDPSWHTKISGHALVGAAFLQPEALMDLISIVPEPHYSCSELSQPGRLQLRIKIYRNDQMQGSVVGHLSADDGQ